MKKFEYLKLSNTNYSLSGVPVIVDCTDENQASRYASWFNSLGYKTESKFTQVTISNAKSPLLIFNLLGANGWDMVGWSAMYVGSNLQIHTSVFKREIGE